MPYTFVNELPPLHTNAVWLVHGPAPGKSNNDNAQQPPGGSVIDPMYVPVTIAWRAVVPHTPQLVPTSPTTEALQRTGPVAGPWNPTGIMMTEVAVQQQHRPQDHHMIMDSDWLYIAPPHTQIEVGPSQNLWHANISGDESDVILGWKKVCIHSFLYLNRFLIGCFVKKSWMAKLRIENCSLGVFFLASFLSHLHGCFRKNTSQLCYIVYLTST